MLKSFDEIRDTIQQFSRKRTISIAMADDESVLEAVKRVDAAGIADSLLVGDETRIRKIAAQIGYTPKPGQIIPVTGEGQIALRAVELVRNGRADILMKGHISTPILMKAVLDKEKGLRTGEVLSHVAVAEIPSYPKLLAVSDGGINILPDLETKESILRNMLQVLYQLRIKTPRIALLCPIEKVNPKIAETVDAAELQRRAQKGAYGPALIEGPIAMDVALSAAAARRKGLSSKIAGNTDALLVPNITTGNALIKVLMRLIEARVGGVVVGARVPIILLSRSDTPGEKLDSIALSILVSDYSNL